MEQFYMPTKVCCQEEVVRHMRDTLRRMGKKVLIVTGQQSAFINGSYMEIKNILEEEGIRHYIFSEVEENPSIYVIERAMALFHTYEVDYVIALGGGSVIDSAKAIAVLLKNRDLSARDLFARGDLEAIPVVAIPTTAGTGSETNPYAIFTDHDLKTKVNFKPKVFPVLALMDVRYFMDIPVHITNNTAVDALCHSIEGMLVTSANVYSDAIAEQALRQWAQASGDLILRNYTKEMRLHLMHASTLAGMVIAQVGTSIPHGLGYHLTYFHEIAHGKATALFLGELLALHPNQEKVQNILAILGLKSIGEFKNLIVQLVGQVEIGMDEAVYYAFNMFQNKNKLQNHPAELTEDNLLQMIIKSIIVY